MLQLKKDNVSSKVKSKQKSDEVNIYSDLKEVKIVEPNLEFPIEDNEKTLSSFKKVEGVLNYFQQVRDNKEKDGVIKFLLDLVTDKEYLFRCQNFNNICFVRLPIIVIAQNYCEAFKLFLSKYYKYQKFKDNTNLIKYLILGSEEIKDYETFHSPLNNNLRFAAECINTGLITYYNSDQIYSINKKLKDYFNKNNIKDLDIELYYSGWTNKVIEIFFDYILFYYNQSPEVILCKKCKKTAIFTYINYNFHNINEQQIYEDMEENQTYEKSIDIANNMVNNVDFSNFFIKEKDKEKNDNSSCNVIYYDENFNINRNEVVDDSFVFEKECNGTFILISNVKSMLLILKELKESEKSPKFHLISIGSKFENLMKYLTQYKDLYNYIISACIYTFDINKYSYLKEKYNIIKGIYSDRYDVVNYIKNNKIKNNIKYKVSKLITYKDYTEKYIEFHKIICLQYGKLYQKSSYLTALNILEEYLMSYNKIDTFDIKLFTKNLEVFSQGPKDYKKIINEYTNESFYALFNKWLNSIDPLAIRKIAFFISGLQLSLNIYGKREKKSIISKKELYRGSLFNYSLVLNYVRNIGNIITFPSFLSTTEDIEVAKDFSKYNFSQKEREGLFSANYIININSQSNWISQGFNISNISSYQNEKEILFQPFCFFRITNVKVDMDKRYCFIYLELIGKKEIWEEKMNENSSVLYKKEENFIQLI